MNDKKRRFEFKKGSSNKYWEIYWGYGAYDHYYCYTRYGRIGTKGQKSKPKVYQHHWARNSDRDKLIESKLEKGYVEIKLDIMPDLDTPIAKKKQKPKVTVVEKPKVPKKTEYEDPFLDQLDNLELDL